MKQFIRNFKKQKTIGLLNICSLSLGVMVTIIVGLYAINELSFDSFHKDKANIYRTVFHVTMNDSPTKLGSAFAPIGIAAKDKFPQIRSMVRVFPNHTDLRINSVFQSEIDVFIVDTDFFSFFSFPLKKGSPDDVLSSPDRIVISESAAVRYFQGSDPIGQVLTISNHDFTVSGVMKDMPRNSSLQADFILPFYGDYLERPENAGDGFITFFNIQKGADFMAIENSMNEVIFEAMPSLKSMDAYYKLEHLSKMHFSEGFMIDKLVKGNKPMVMVLLLVAFIILIISCINFTNLFISTSFIRAKSIGLMKSVGASKTSLIRSFYEETAYYTIIAISVGIIISWFVLPVFNNFTDTNLIIDFTSGQLYVFLFVLCALTIALAGTFPALYITRFNPVETLVGKFKGKRVSLFQKSLVIIQFAASITLLIVVSFMQKQVNLILSKDLGFDKENIIYVTGRVNFGLGNFETLREEFMKHPFIVDVTAKNSVPTEWRQGQMIGRIELKEESALMEMNLVMPNYFELMNMKIIDGENPFYLESQDSIIPVILNESAVRLLNLESPVNSLLSASNGMATLIVKGVMKNAHIRSLRDEIDPQVYMKISDRRPVFFFKYTGDPKQTIEVVKQKWQELEPDTPFQYHFLDETYKQLYSSEMNVSKVLSFAMLITFIISIAGLFAMAFYATQRRIREIGLRKVNGATLKDLLLLLNRDFIIWISISFVIATPIAWFSLQSWLDSFTVRTSLSIWIFILIGVISLIITMLTTSYQTWKVTNMNPVKTLKQE